MVGDGPFEEGVVGFGQEIEVNHVADGVEQIAFGRVEIGGELDAARASAGGRRSELEFGGKGNVVDGETAEGALDRFVGVNVIVGSEGVFRRSRRGDGAYLEENVFRQRRSVADGATAIGFSSVSDSVVGGGDGRGDGLLVL